MLTRFKTLSVNQFTLITALFYVCIFNIPLFTFIHEGIEKQPEVEPLFIASMPLFFTFALGLVFSFFFGEVSTKTLVYRAHLNVVDGIFCHDEIPGCI